MPAARSDSRKAAVVADVVDGDRPLDGREGRELGQQLAEVLDPRRSQRLDRARRDAVDAHAAPAQVLGQEAHAGFQRGLGQTHGVVVGHHPHRAQVGQRQQGGAAAQTGQGRLGEGGEAVGGDVVGDAEVLAAQAVEEVAGDRLAGCEGDGMHEAVEFGPGLAELGEQPVDLRVVADVAGKDQFRPELPRELGDAVLEALADVAECEFGPLSMAGARDAIGDGPVRQHARDEQPLAAEEPHVVSVWVASAGTARQAERIIVARRHRHAARAGTTLAGGLARGL
jgi:hypothetical protein